MTGAQDFTHYIMLPHIRVEAAQAFAAPQLHGFPAMTAFTGLKTALERRCRTPDRPLRFHAVGVVAHDVEELATRGEFHQTRNPILKNRETRPFQPEGRLNMTVTLLFAVSAPDYWLHEDRPELPQQVHGMLSTMRVAGGTVVPELHPDPTRFPLKPVLMRKADFEDSWNKSTTADLLALPEEAPPPPLSEDGKGEKPKAKTAQKPPSQRRVPPLKRMLMPGATLLEEPGLLGQRLEELRQEDPQATPFDAWLSLGMVTQHSEKDEAGKVQWVSDRKGLGGVVPIAVGYGAIGPCHPAGTVADARNASVPFQAVESLYSIGRWKWPCALTDPIHLLWAEHTEPERGVYRVGMVSPAPVDEGTEEATSQPEIVSGQPQEATD
ncbi:hypothetical protein E3E12_02320 [Formicincola oecophyllae]|uniref:Type I-F CRISPR-associated protein Csy2 n=1 Tax=Formicincola oecophyllae TaxID=2558361 RepID=A0A4Y6U9V0_9PROT|nr:type I-F CRISPR-associated protein Csy2 [Formicincola oecophyllae]QDH13226.1 hypothetical protein E3E12_02320 [Formicincola oecophyllae]